MLCTAEPDGCRQALFFFSLNPRCAALRIINRVRQQSFNYIFRGSGVKFIFQTFTKNTLCHKKNNSGFHFYKNKNIDRCRFALSLRAY